MSETTNLDLAVLKKLQDQKRNILMQLGSLREYEEQFVEDLKNVNKQLTEHDKNIRKAHNIPDDKLWRINETGTIEIISEEQLVSNLG